MKTLLWLDDIRNPLTGDWLMSYAAEWAYDKSNKVVWVKTFREFVLWITAYGLPDKICFDNDLGEVKEGYDCAKWLVEYCMDGDLDLPNYSIQSGNTVAVDNIRSLLANYTAHRQERGT